MWRRGCLRRTISVRECSPSWKFPATIGVVRSVSDTVQAIHVQPALGAWRERGTRRPNVVLLTGIAVALVAGLPVVITVVQAIQGGAGAAKTAFTASATPTLFLHTIELAALAT